MNPINKVNQVRISSPLFAGLLYAFICMALATLAISFLLVLADFKEDSLHTYIYIVHGLSTFIGGFICGKKAEHKGWYYGGLMGAIYSLVIIVTSFLAFDASISLQTLFFVILSFATGALGGVFGVNIRK